MTAQAIATAPFVVLLVALLVGYFRSLARDCGWQAAAWVYAVIFTVVGLLVFGVLLAAGEIR